MEYIETCRQEHIHEEYLRDKAQRENVTVEYLREQEFLRQQEVLRTEEFLRQEEFSRQEEVLRQEALEPFDWVKNAWVSDDDDNSPNDRNDDKDPD